MYYEFNKDEYQQLKNALQALAGPEDTTPTAKKVLVGSQPQAYQFDFNDTNYTCDIKIDDESYKLICTKSLYGQLIVLVASESINKKHLSKLYQIHDSLTPQGYGVIDIDQKALLPKLNTAMQKTNFQLRNDYWHCETNYEDHTFRLFFNKVLIFEINWQYGFYYNPGLPTFPAPENPKPSALIDFPLNEMLEVSQSEYQRLTGLTNEINEPN